MPLTKRQKYMGGVMLLAGVAFFWDRAHSAKPPEEAEATPEVLHSDAAPVHAAALTTTIASERLAARLSRIAKEFDVDPLHATNAFALPGNWSIGRSAAASAATTAPVGPTELEIDHGLADEFVRKHHVDAVMSKTATGYAIVDGRTIQVGQSLDHFKLVTVKTASAVFQRHRIRVEIRITQNTDLHLDGSTIDNHPARAGEE